jgi:hypothetical protein
VKPRSYNPLDYGSLSDTLARELMASELMPLSEIEKFYGDGVYALFYCGDFPAYAELSSINSKAPGSFPIYIGKAGPKTLTGSELDASAVDTPLAGSRLYDRLSNDHRKSIVQATNLDVAHFSCRMLVLNAVWVPLTESALIARYVPIWNSIVPGFGNHPPGKGRAAGRISRWDILHPGRGRETSSESDVGFDDLCAQVRSAIKERVRLLGLQ